MHAPAHGARGKRWTAKKHYHLIFWTFIGLAFVFSIEKIRHEAGVAREAVSDTASNVGYIIQNALPRPTNTH